MAEQWYTSAGDGLTPSGEPAPAPRPAAVFELRPLSVGEILDRTFSIYRSRFWLFVGISSIAAFIQLVFSVVRVLSMHMLHNHMSRTTLSSINMFVGGLISLVMLLPYAVAQAATVYALAEVYLGHTATIGSSLRAVTGKWYRYAGITIWQVWSMIWIMLVLMIPAFMLISSSVTGLMALGGILMFLAVFGGFTVGVILYLRNSLAVPAAVVEVLTVRAAMRRSKDLAVAAKGRIFLVLLVAAALYCALGALQMPLAFGIGMVAKRGGEALGEQMALLAVNFLGSCVIVPVGMLGLTLLYFDQRVRMEAFDLEVLLAAEPLPEAMIAPAAESVDAHPVVFAAEAPATPEAVAEAPPPTVPAPELATTEAADRSENPAGLNGDATNV